MRVGGPMEKGESSSPGVGMDIGPVAGIRVMPEVKVAPAEQRLRAVFDIEALARPVDDGWTGDSGNSAGGQDEVAEEAGSVDEVEEKKEPGRVDLFA